MGSDGKHLRGSPSVNTYVPYTDNGDCQVGDPVPAKFR